MASLYQRGKCWSVQFEDRDQLRRSISLGRLPKREATAIKYRIEQLIASQLAGTSPDAETSRWLGSAGEKLIAKLSKVGLVENRSSATLGAFVDRFVADRTADPKFKPRTLASYAAAYKSLRKHFGELKPLRSITKGEARAWRTLIAAGKSENTIRKWTAKVKTLFNAAVEHELIDRNPFDGLAASTISVRDRDYFVTREECDKVLAACPSLEWRLIFALARYGGLRCPSEVLELRWGDVLWDQKRFIVRSVKTEHHEGHETRITPLFPELAPLLEEAFEAADDGAEFVIARSRDNSTNLRTQLSRIVTRAGLKPWPKLFQNLRASRATELADEFPGHVAAAWLGHSEKIAKRHYWQVTDDHFDTATGAESDAPKSAAYMLQKASETGRSESQAKSEKALNAAVCEALRLVSTCTVAETGLEPVQEFPPGGF